MLKSASNPQVPPDPLRSHTDSCCIYCRRFGTIRSIHPPRRHHHHHHHHHHHSASALVTKCEVLKHSNSPAVDCWIVCEDRVYDVSRYLRDHTHPGGERAFIKRAGGAMDCLRDFNFHSAKAKKLWSEYQIATIVACDHPMEGNDGESYCTIC